MSKLRLCEGYKGKSRLGKRTDIQHNPLKSAHIPTGFAPKSLKKRNFRGGISSEFAQKNAPRPGDLDLVSRALPSELHVHDVRRLRYYPASVCSLSRSS